MLFPKLGTYLLSISIESPKQKKLENDNFHHLTRAETSCIRRDAKQSICGGESEDQIAFAKDRFRVPFTIPYSLFTCSS